MKYLTKFRTIAICGITIGFISACNTDQLPVGAKVNVSPTQKSIDITVEDISQPSVCFVAPNALYQDVPVNITVTDAQDAPLGNIEVGVYTDFAGNTFSGPEVLQIFADRNGNGVVDPLTELVSGSDDGVFTMSTDEFHGTAMVFVRMNLTCPYSGELYVFAGPSSAVVDLSVTQSGPSSSDTEENVEEDVVELLESESPVLTVQQLEVESGLVK